MKTLVLGLGNELYGDDGVGIHVIRQLRKEIKGLKATNKEDIDMEECSLSGLALLDVIAGYDRLILVDTIKRRAPLPGRIHLLAETEIRSIPGPSPHYVSVPQTIQLGRQLGLRVPSQVQIVAVEAKNLYSLGEGLSEAMKEKLPAIVKTVKDILMSG